MKKCGFLIALCLLCGFSYAQLTVNATTQNVRCFGQSNGSATVTATGGMPAYTYTWLPAGQTTSVVANLPPGNYTVLVSDASAATGSAVVTITQPTQLTATTTQTNGVCSGQCTGAFIIVPGGGTSPYTYYTTMGTTTPYNPNVCAGNYSYTVTDSKGCIFSNTVTMIQASSTLSVAISSTNVACGGACTGSASATAVGGTPPYTYTWSPGGINTAVVSGLCIGTVTVQVKDVNGCLYTQTRNIGQAASSMTASISSTNVPCGSSCTGSASATVSGGTAPYSYTWSPGGVNSFTASNLCVGSNTLQVRDANGCLYSQMLNITQVSAMTLTVNVTNPSCSVLCNGTATAVIGGPVSGPFTYSWTFTGQTFTTSTVQNRCAGNYTLTATDVTGCSKTISGNIASPVNAIPNASLSAVRYNESCYLTGDGAIDLTVGGTNPGPFSYQWSNGTTNQDITNVTSGTYSVIVSDANLACAIYSGSITSAGTNCGTISGNVFVDVNTDCINNGSDYSFLNAMVVVNPGSRLGYTNAAGDYTVNSLPYGTYSVSLATGSVVATCNTILTRTVSAGNPNSINNSFALSANALAQPDVIAWVSSTGVVPGFSSRINYTIRNQNNNPSSGKFKIVFPTAFVPDITTIFPAGATQSGDTVIWNYSLPFIYSPMLTYVDFVPPVSTPLGSTFTTCVIATTTVPDLVPANNTFCYSRIVTGSFDPNDKTVSPVGTGTAGNITVNDKELTYLIRFQNTGNGPAVNIVVKDTLSTFVDVMTLEMLSVSHTYKIDILPGNVLRWKFDNIMLADSGSNEPASHGYIQYRIKQKPNNPLGTQLKNTAYIYFDFNDPVITNTALNTIWQAPVGIEALSNQDGNWLVYPNPATNMLYVRNAAAVAEGATQLELMNTMGQVLHTESFSGASKSLDLSSYANGVYFVKLVTEKESTMKRIVISR